MLKDLKLKLTYNSDEDDILNDFYIPTLSESIVYKRETGDFSSSALAVASVGIVGLVKNGGKMLLLANARLKPDDYREIERGIKDRSKILSEAFIKDLDSITDKFVEDHVKALGWMYANNLLEIKFVILPSGIFHAKVGIFEDREGNKIAFKGSVNESWMGWKSNIEDFSVYKSWEVGQLPYLNEAVSTFEKYWTGRNTRGIIVECPEAIRKGLVERAPPEFSDINIEKWHIKRKVGLNIQNLNPWNFQKRAIDACKSNNFNGILKMATGTGKTITTMFILEKFFDAVKRYGNRILILVPSGKELVGGQWEEVLNKNKADNGIVFLYDSKIKTSDKKDLRYIWKKKLADADKFNIFLIITIQSLNKLKLWGEKPQVLIADEVHEYGTKNRIELIKEVIGSPTYKIGLSATPQRYYDPKGTQEIFDYFGKIIFDFPIKEAQREKKYPGAETVLADYYYTIYLTNLTLNEEKEVAELTKKIGRDVAIEKNIELSEADFSLGGKIEKLIRERSKKLKKSQSKLAVLKHILEKEGRQLKQCIVYCEDTHQLNDVKKIFDELKITSYIEYHSEIIKRAEALELFREKNCRFVLSINCLDQGVDIPDCQNLILMAGSGNPRQYIQRRGRVLRNTKDKGVVKIVDIISLPQELRDAYKGMIMTRLLRAWEFIKCSLSSEEKQKLNNIMEHYSVTSEELDKEIENW